MNALLEYQLRFANQVKYCWVDKYFMLSVDRNKHVLTLKTCMNVCPLPQELLLTVNTCMDMNLTRSASHVQYLIIITIACRIKFLFENNEKIVYNIANGRID